MKTNVTWKRFLAYFIDIAVVIFVSTLLSQLTFLNPTNDKYDAAYERYDAYLDEYYKSDNLLDIDYLYSDEYEDINYELTKYGASFAITEIICYLLYFTLFPKYNNGQTIGKKLTKIKVKSVNGDEVSIKQYGIRSIILFNLWIKIINVIVIIAASKTVYMQVTGITSAISMAITGITIALVLFSENKRGLHDLASKTEVEVIS